jgi:hypothetical protein
MPQYLYRSPDAFEPRLKGRRLRTLMNYLANGSDAGVMSVSSRVNEWLLDTDGMAPEAMLEKFSAERPEKLENIAVYRGMQCIGRDPELSPALLDLALQIAWDLHLACEAAFTGKPYAGVRRGIEPVSDAHVRKVIEASQRELNRELRPGKDGKRRPAVKLDELPWPIQRAFAERRRLRYRQWGITKERWEQNRISLFEVPEDPDWEPPFPPVHQYSDTLHYFIAY